MRDLRTEDLSPETEPTETAPTRVPRKRLLAIGNVLLIPLMLAVVLIGWTLARANFARQCAILTVVLLFLTMRLACRIVLRVAYAGLDPA